MYFRVINEKKAVKFTSDLLDYYKKIDNGCIDKILTLDDEESCRDNAGWYRREDNQHKLFINVPNLLLASFFVDSGVMDVDAFYALLTLCTGHEFRHFLQGRVIYDGINIDGYTQDDVFNAELMLYIRNFFDAYYLLNKGSVKYELDAEKFSIINGIEYLKDNYPKMNVEKSMLDAINFFAFIQSQGGIKSTLPLGCQTIEDVIQELENAIKNNVRVQDLNESLFVNNSGFYDAHEEFGLDEDQVITKELLDEYRAEKDGGKRDLLVAKRIISLLEYPEKSLTNFPHLKKRYLEKTL